MLKVSGLFLDYDGTLSPLNIARQQSWIPPHTEALLRLMEKLIPVALITAKDLDFILPRTNFARAWAAVLGLEIKIGSRLFKAPGLEKLLPHLELALQHARENLAEGLVVEEKRDSEARCLAFCIDWRQATNGKEFKRKVQSILAYCKTLPLHVVEYPGQPYFDVYPCNIDKGQALRLLKENLGLSSGIMYIGDSPTDNSAFRQADISVGVTDNGKPPNLDCEFWIKFDEVAYFLSRLFKNQLVFSPALPGLQVRK